MKTIPETQNKQIRLHLQSGSPLTSIQALKLFGCFRLSARIYDLKKQGLDIEAKPIYKGRKHFVQYRIKY